MGDEPENKLGVTSGELHSPASADDTGAVPGYRVQLPVFEGPLDLLLHLIQQHELDIFDIPIAFITQKYVEYVTLMQDLNIDIASEYLVMAATLTHIKSKMLLPASPDDEDEEDEFDIDPRAELVRRLLEYQKYREAAAELGDRMILGRDVFTRGAPAPSVEGPAPLAPVGLFKLLDAFQAVLKRAKQGADHQIDVDRFSISDRINQLSDILRERRRVDFEDLFSDSQTRADLIVTFLALLEMTRVRLIRLMQAGPLTPISIELAVDDDSSDELLSESVAPESAAPGDIDSGSNALDDPVPADVTESGELDDEDASIARDVPDAEDRTEPE
jgi:segregation and condensation protein A